MNIQIDVCRFQTHDDPCHAKPPEPQRVLIVMGGMGEKAEALSTTLAFFPQNDSWVDKVCHKMTLEFLTVLCPTFLMLFSLRARAKVHGYGPHHRFSTEIDMHGWVGGLCSVTSQPRGTVRLRRWCAPAEESSGFT